jgi:hypothetical protein
MAKQAKVVIKPKKTFHTPDESFDSAFSKLKQHNQPEIFK